MFFSGASHRHHRLLARLPSIPRRRRGGGGRMWREQRRRRRPYSPSLFPQPCSHHWCDPGMFILKNDENRMKLPFPFRFPWTSCPPEPAHQLNHSPPSPPPLLRRRRRRRSTPLRGERGGGDVDAITLWGNSQPSDPISAEPILISSKKCILTSFPSADFSSETQNILSEVICAVGEYYKFEVFQVPSVL